MAAFVDPSNEVEPVASPVTEIVRAIASFVAVAAVVAESTVPATVVIEIFPVPSNKAEPVTSPLKAIVRAVANFVADEAFPLIVVAFNVIAARVLILPTLAPIGVQ